MELVIAEHIVNLLGCAHTVGTKVINAVYVRRYINSSCLCSQKRLHLRVNRSSRHIDSRCRQNTDSLQALLGSRNLNIGIVAQLLADLIGLLHHIVCVIADYLHMQLAFLDEVANLLQHLIGRAFFLSQDRRITGHAIHRKKLVHGANLINVCIVNNQFHSLFLLLFTKIAHI